MLNISKFIKKIFKSDNDKELDRLKSLVIQINNNEDLVKNLKEDNDSCREIFSDFNL